MSEFAIETEGLTKVFRGAWSKRELVAVDNVSIRVPRGSTYGLLGPNGAGKTTFVKMLLSCAHPTAGRAMVFGKNSQIPEARRPIGYLPENHRFPTYMTGRDMLNFYGALSGMETRAREKRIPELLNLVGLDERAHNLRLGKYSKGMLQRVGLAQALIHSPKLLVLDEPSDGVDPVGRKHIRDVLQDLEKQGVTIFLNSHLLAEVELFCREVAIIQKGKLALTGTVQELTSGSGYRVESIGVPEALETELRGKARSFASADGTLSLLFGTREDANLAVDVLRSNGCEIESFGRSRSTLEEVFMKTVDPGPAAAQAKGKQ
ncbi:MAG TPA: ABC transporter ATP-binding protein [Bryobacteraceae bacterium]|jgi:ABC-2 type transport system ATP-binding protein|nr:ABC transporter ATP-binding protein [Bryobacteraceae bacterium]